jgi:ABC-2 type transport system permease protein
MLLNSLPWRNTVINHFVHTVHQNIRSWLIYAGALVIIQIALAAVFNQAGASLPGGMGMLIDLLPDAVRGFVGSSELDLLTANGALAVGYNHPLTKVAISVFAVGLTSGAIAGELERGTLDLLLARPLRRRELLLGNGLALLLATLFVCGSMFLGTVVGAYLGGINGEVAWIDFIWITLNAIALVLAMSGLGYLFSVLAHRGGQAASWTGGLLAGMFFLDWFATLWDKVETFTPISLFHYFQPPDIINGTTAWSVNITVLLTVAVLAFSMAIVVFERRDLTR